jgi:hypothetical protein
MRRHQHQPQQKHRHQQQPKKKEKRVDTRLKWHPGLVVLLIIGGAVALISIPYITGNPPGQKSRPAPVIEQRSNDPAIEAKVMEVASKFICSCGTCGEQPLDICTCNTAVQERQFIRGSLQGGQTVDQIIAAVNTTYGWMKPEFAARYDSLSRSRPKNGGLANGLPEQTRQKESGQARRGAPSTKIKPPTQDDSALLPILSRIVGDHRIATAADRLEIFSHFKCPCGQCGIDELKDCSCNHPRGATEVKAFVDEKIRTGKFTVAQLITEVEIKYGGKK